MSEEERQWENAAANSKRAKAMLYKVLKQWEEDWWNDFAAEAEEAAAKGDTWAMFRDNNSSDGPRPA